MVGTDAAQHIFLNCAVDNRDFGANGFCNLHGVGADAAAGAINQDALANIRSLKQNGRYLSGNARLSVLVRSVFTTRFSDKTARVAFARETREELLALKGMIEDGEIGSIVDKVLPMDQAAEAHRLVETEQRRGAIVIAIGKDRLAA